MGRIRKWGIWERAALKRALHDRAGDSPKNSALGSAKYLEAHYLYAVFDRAKFKALVHYVIAQAGGRPGFGATKLNKVLWFADARQYVTTGHAITGAEYVRRQFGPVPKLIMPIRQELEDEGKIRVDPPRSEFEGWRFRSLRPPVDVGLSDSERVTVDYWIKHISSDHTATSISDESHDYAWEIAKMGEPLPYFAYLATRVREPTDDEVEWARDSAKRLGLA